MARRSKRRPHNLSLDRPPRSHGPRPIWPRILKALSGGHTFSAEMISIVLGDERPESVYASMSSLGAYDNRWWIRPVDYWRRDGLFYITAQGASALRKYTRKNS